MALKAINKVHAAQIKAGAKGRNDGHIFEKNLTREINTLTKDDINQAKDIITKDYKKHYFICNPAKALLAYISETEDLEIEECEAKWLGGLATSGEGDELYDDSGKKITSCKSDVLLYLKSSKGNLKRGISVKHCSKKTPTNDQMFFTTASAFCSLLRKNGIDVSRNAEIGMKMFCGDAGYTPLENFTQEELANRKSDPRRYYWEELDGEIQDEWEKLILKYQDEITLLLFKKGYKDDPFPPDYLLHQVKAYEDFNHCPTAIFTMDQIVALSKEYEKFYLSEYKIYKGTYKNDDSVHLAPKFGFIQFQRGGQKQHPTQLQFNLKAGYYNQIK